MMSDQELILQAAKSHSSSSESSFFDYVQSQNNTAATFHRSLNEQPTFDNVRPQTDTATRFHSRNESTNALSQNNTLLNQSFNESFAFDDLVT